MHKLNFFASSIMGIYPILLGNRAEEETGKHLRDENRFASDSINWLLIFALISSIIVSTWIADSGVNT